LKLAAAHRFTDHFGTYSANEQKMPFHNTNFCFSQQQKHKYKKFGRPKVYFHLDL
jgi:hypothetical protein